MRYRVPSARGYRSSRAHHPIIPLFLARSIVCPLPPSVLRNERLSRLVLPYSVVLLPILFSASFFLEESSGRCAQNQKKTEISPINTPGSRQTSLSAPPLPCPHCSIPCLERCQVREVDLPQLLDGQVQRAAASGREGGQGRLHLQKRSDNNPKKISS